MKEGCLLCYFRKKSYSDRLIERNNGKSKYRMNSLLIKTFSESLRQCNAKENS